MALASACKTCLGEHYRKVGTELVRWLRTSAVASLHRRFARYVAHSHRPVSCKKLASRR